jgi:hypothetical protein
MPFWPVLKSSHPSFDSDHAVILKTLKVGTKYPIFGGMRWNGRDVCGRWAIHLCQEIEIMQEGHCVDESSKEWEFALLELKPFSADTWEQWWAVAKGLLETEYIDVVDISELVNSVAGKTDTTPGRKRKRILQTLKDHCHPVKTC